MLDELKEVTKLRAEAAELAAEEAALEEAERAEAAAAAALLAGATVTTPARADVASRTALSTPITTPSTCATSASDAQDSSGGIGSRSISRDRRPKGGLARMKQGARMSEQGKLHTRALKQAEERAAQAQAQAQAQTQAQAQAQKAAAAAAAKDAAWKNRTRPVTFMDPMAADFTPVPRDLFTPEVEDADGPPPSHEDEVPSTTLYHAIDQGDAQYGAQYGASSSEADGYPLPLPSLPLTNRQRLLLETLTMAPATEEELSEELCSTSSRTGSLSWRPSSNVSSKHEMSTLCAILMTTDETRRPLMASDDH